MTRKENEMILQNDRSVLAEAFRILYTNLQYLIVNTAEKERGNTIFVTSTVKGEGKTLVSFNLALTLANTERKCSSLGPTFEILNYKDLKKMPGFIMELVITWRMMILSLEILFVNPNIMKILICSLQETFHLIHQNYGEDPRPVRCLRNSKRCMIISLLILLLHWWLQIPS